MISWKNPQDKMMYTEWGNIDPWNYQGAQATYEFFGLSTDTKPRAGDYGNVPNGAIFFEMDTSKIYLYDLRHDKWLEQKVDQGGDPS